MRRGTYGAGGSGAGHDNGALRRDSARGLLVVAVAVLDIVTMVSLTTVASAVMDVSPVAPIEATRCACYRSRCCGGDVRSWLRAGGVQSPISPRDDDLSSLDVAISPEKSVAAIYIPNLAEEDKESDGAVPTVARAKQDPFPYVDGRKNDAAADTTTYTY